VDVHVPNSYRYGILFLSLTFNTVCAIFGQPCLKKIDNLSLLILCPDALGHLQQDDTNRCEAIVCDRVVEKCVKNQVHWPDT
jgi:hypothetical protein